MIESFLLPERILKKYKASNIKITIFKLRKKYEEMLSKYLSSNGDRKHGLREKKNMKRYKNMNAPQNSCLSPRRLFLSKFAAGLFFLIS